MTSRENDLLIVIIDICFDHMSRHVTDTLKENELSFDKWRLVFVFRSCFNCAFTL